MYDLDGPGRLALALVGHESHQTEGDQHDEGERNP
jgi:hypothetical protein